MRLINADKIDFGKVFIGASEFAKDTREAAQKLIAEQPTSYDVDKVVEKLVFQTSGLTTWAEDEAYKLGLEKAIEIVKSGGID